MENKYVKTIKREDGSRIRIIVEISIRNFSSFIYQTRVQTCEPKKRTWKNTYDEASYSYRCLSMADRSALEKKTQFEYATEAEINEARLELWQSIKPTIIKEDLS